MDDFARGAGNGGGDGVGGNEDALPSASLYVIVGLFEFVPLVVHGVEAIEVESVRFCLDELRPRPNLRNENRGRKPNFMLSHSALKLRPFWVAFGAVASVESVFEVETTRLFALCLRLFFFDELDLLLLVELLSPVSMVAIELAAVQTPKTKCQTLKLCYLLMRLLDGILVILSYGIQVK